MMRAYANYKDSGVDWLGKIPAGWNAKRMRYLYRDISEKNQPNAKLLSVTQSQGVVPRSWVKNRMVMPSGNLASFKFIKEGDFAISLRSFEGGLEYCHHDGIISPAYTVLKSARDDLFQGYYKFLFKSLSFISEIQTSIIGIREGKNISFEELSYSLMLIPPLPEQTAIANFLDDKTAKIEALVGIKRRQIALLGERKQILIQNAVTKGMNPDAPMKDSGVDWIGEIPVGWEVKPAKHLFFEVDERSENGDEELLSVSHMTGVTPRSEKTVSMFLAEDYSGSKICVEGDLVFNIMWAWMGALGVSGQLGIVSPSYAIFRQLKYQIFSRGYLEMLMQSLGYIEHYNKVSTGLHSSRLRFYSHMFLNMKIGYPSFGEQERIVMFLSKETGKISKAVYVLENQITKLNEYKVTLINAAVTGKIKVA